MMIKLTTNEDVYALLYSSTASAALGAAIETGLLWLLAEQPLAAQGVAQALNIPAKRCHYWLQLLQELGMLENTPQGYAPSSLARSAILDTNSQESWAHLALDERERSAGVHNLALYIRQPGSVWAAQGLAEPKDYVAKMQASPARARQFTHMLYEVHQNLGNEVAARLDLRGVRRLMDVGGGSGVVSMALLRKSPDLTATVFDLENVCLAGRQIAAGNSLSHRLTYQPADILHDDFPGNFDLALLCDVGIFDEALYRRIWASLNQGGRLVLVEHFSPAENVAPASRLEWTFLDSLEDPDFTIPTIPQAQAALLRVGFHLLPGEQTLPDRRILIQAEK